MASRGRKPRPNPAAKKPRKRSAAPSRGAATPRPSAARPAARRPAPRKAASGFARLIKWSLVIAVLVVAAVAVTGCAVYASMSSQLPDPDPSKARGRDQTTVVYDRDGKVLVRLYAEENRADVPVAKMPQHLKQAVIATEDRRFYEHEGVDPLGIARALAVDIARGEAAQGGSTITQQYVKQAFVTSEKTLKRKVQEAILAQKVESRYSKEEILERYLNTIYFGHGAYGVESASRTYFGKSVSDLSLPESAVLAGVIKSPRRYSPYLEPENAVQRRNVVLAQMLDQGYIDAAVQAEAAAAPIKLAGLKSRAARAPYFVEWIKEQLVERFGERQVYRGGLRVHTTLDPTAQKAAEKAIATVLDAKGDPSTALVAVKPGTGEILAMVGGRDFSSQQFNVAVDGRRQPGSAFKPFVLATALSEGISPEQPYKSGPARLRVGDQTWSVTGLGGGTTMRLRPATERSVNSVFARLILEVGAEDVVKTAESLGLRKGIEPVPAIALGGLKDGVSPLEMANAYATLAASGRRSQPFALTSVDGPDGTSLYRARVRRTQAIDPAVAYLTTDILKGVLTRGTGTAAAIGRPAAGKTGTTQEYRDAWFVGYTPDIATAVWVGYPDEQREMKSVHGRAVTGGSFPAQIWARFMRAAHKGLDERSFRKPAGLTRVKLCAETGGTVTEFCPGPFSALVLTRFKPKPCTVHTMPVEVTVPKLVGLTKEDALAKLERLGLVASVTERALPGYAAGIVGKQNPAAGAAVSAESTITLVVAIGDAADELPIAKFTLPDGATSGEPVKLDASESSDNGSIKIYYWEFGDGKNGKGAKPTHTWSAPGDYEVTLWVTDDAGQQGTTTQVVSVR